MGNQQQVKQFRQLNRFYTEQDVKTIQALAFRQGVEAEHRHALIRHEIGGLLHNIKRELNELGAVITALSIKRDFTALPGWLVVRESHRSLSDATVRFDQMLRQHMPHLATDPDMMALTGLVTNVLKAIREGEKCRSQPIEAEQLATKLLSALGEMAKERRSELVEAIQKTIDRGGRPEQTESPVLNALYDCALPFYERHKSHPNPYAQTANDLWQKIKRKPRNAKEELIYQEWSKVKTTRQQRRDQVRLTFAEKHPTARGI